MAYKVRSNTNSNSLFNTRYVETPQYKGVSRSQFSDAVSRLIAKQSEQFGAIWRNECAKKIRHFGLISFEYKIIYFVTINFLNMSEY